MVLKNVKFMLCLLMLVPVYFAIKKNTKNVKHMSTFLFDTHSKVASLSCESLAQIKDFCTNVRVPEGQLARCAHSLQEKFPYIKKVVIQAHHSPHVYKIKLYADAPIARINQDVILTDHDVITKDHVWNQSVLEQIPHFMVASDDQSTISLACKKFLKKMNFLKAHNDYTIEWINSFLIKFYDKRYPQLTMLARPETAGTVLLSSHYKRFRELVIEEKCTTLKGQKKWCIDTRFKNQMIVFEGEKHEKLIRS